MEQHTAERKTCRVTELGVWAAGRPCLLPCGCSNWWPSASRTRRVGRSAEGSGSAGPCPAAGCSLPRACWSGGSWRVELGRRRAVPQQGSARRHGAAWAAAAQGGGGATGRANCTAQAFCVQGGECRVELSGCGPEGAGEERGGRQGGRRRSPTVRASGARASDVGQRRPERSAARGVTS